jgi:hypothetical protein
VALQSAPARVGAGIKENSVTRHLTRTATAILTAALMLSASAGAALGAVGGPPNEDFSFAERGLTAQAFSVSCEGPDASGVTRCESTQIYIFDGRQRSSDDELGHANGGLTYLCVYHLVVAIGEDWVPVEPAVAEQGCTDDPQLTVVDTLESVTAAAPALELAETVCTYDPETGEEYCETGDAHSVAVEAQFTGTGDIVPQRWTNKSRSIFDDYRCTFSSSGNGIIREATVSITIDGTTLQPGFGQLSEGRTRFAQHCS